MADFSLHSECKIKGGCQEIAAGSPGGSHTSGFFVGMAFLGMALLASVIITGKQNCHHQRSSELQVSELGSGQVLWTCTGRNKTFPPSTSLPVMGELAGVHTASLGGCHHSSKTRTRWEEGFHDELNGHVFDLERDGPRQMESP